MSCAVLFSVSVFVILAWSMTERVWVWFGSDPEVSAMAGTYASALSFAVPGMVAFSQLSQFFSAQRIVRPEAHASTLGMLANLILGLVLVLGWPVPGFDGYGFLACPIVTAAVAYLQLAFVAYVCVRRQRLHRPCWPGFRASEITRDRVRTFLDLYVPAAMSLASDFWRVAAIGSVAATLGEAQVAVFHAAYRIMWIALIFVGALSRAAAINMSLRLGRNDPRGARRAGYVGVGMSAIALVGLGGLVLTRSRWFGVIFTNDEEFLGLLEECSVPFAITLFFMNLSVAIERIPYSMG